MPTGREQEKSEREQTVMWSQLLLALLIDLIHMLINRFDRLGHDFTDGCHLGRRLVRTRVRARVNTNEIDLGVTDANATAEEGTEERRSEENKGCHPSTRRRVHIRVRWHVSGVGELACFRNQLETIESRGRLRIEGRDGRGIQ